MGTHAVEIDALSRRFGSFLAVDGVSFTVDAGEVLGFLGPNGAGKSTTMKMLTGFLRPSSGRALVEGNDAWCAPMRAKALLGYLPEGAPAYPEMTARAFLTFCARARGIGRAEVKRRVDRASERAGLRSMLRQPIDTLSKGYKRRVGLAQAILHEPPVLVLDEPTDGLDPNQKAEVRTLIREMSKDSAVILSTHILEEVEEVCTRTVLIAQGRVLADETPARLRARDPLCHAVRVECAGPLEGVRSAMGAIQGADRVDATPMDGGVVRVLVTPKAGTMLAERVEAVCRSNGWAVRSLSVEPGSLVRVFRDLTIGGAR